MGLVLAVIWAVIGGVIGLVLPITSVHIVRYKLTKKGQSADGGKLNKSILAKLICLLVNGGCWFAVSYLSGSMWQAILLSIIISVSILVALVDMSIRIIPNELVLILALLGIAGQLTINGFESFIVSLIAMVVVMIVFTLLGSILGLNSVGAGDVKLAGAMGLILGWPGLILGLAGMSAVLVIWCLVGILIKKLSLKSMFPMAPFMMLGTIAAVIYRLL